MSPDISTVLLNLIDYLTGTVAHVIFVLAIVGIGYAWLFLGRMPKQYALSALIGIGIIFSASTLARFLIG